MGSLGLDYSFGRPKPADLRAHGYRFVVRYLSRDPSKNLTAAERDGLLKAELDIVLNWEATADGALGGAGQGYADGKDAKLQADALDPSGKCCVYFSVDTDVPTAKFPVVRSYLDAVKTEFGTRPVGVYGQGNLLDYLYERGYRYLWNTNATGWGGISARACLVQQGQVVIDGVTCDVNEARSAYGGWNQAHQPQPAPRSEEEMPLLATHSDGTVYVVAFDLSSKHVVASSADETHLVGTGKYTKVSLSDKQLDSITTT